MHDELRHLELINNKEKISTIHKSKQTWTDPKTALIELIYAFHSHSSLNNGKADIKEIATNFEQIFNIDLGDYYKTYLEMKMRKNSRTKFLDSLRESLLKRMDDSDDYK